MQRAGFACAAWLTVTVALLDAGPRRPLGLDLYRPSADGNPLTTPVIDLGRRLFHERRLSRDRSMACASCHDPRRAFTSGEATATGVGGVRGTRNVPAILNRAWGRSFFWDGRAATLEAQVLQPILDTGELALPARDVVALARTPAYRDRFATAFRPLPDASRFLVDPQRSGSAPAFASSRQDEGRVPSAFSYRIDNPYDGLTQEDAFTLRQVAFALATYVRTIQSGDSPYDRYVHGDRSALDAPAVRGLTIFRGRGGCSSCHVGPLLSDESFHNTGVAWRTGALTDEGRARVTGAAADRGAFKTPTLREVARTAPYMHDGGLATLEDVIEFYDRGGVQNPALDSRVRPLTLSQSEKRDLLAFLRGLSGRIRDRE
jgi:cytochrome c peroxidase